MVHDRTRPGFGERRRATRFERGLGERREANHEAVPRVVFTDPQAAAVGAGEARFSATVPISEVPKTATYTRSYAESNGFLTLLSDTPDTSAISNRPCVCSPSVATAWPVRA